MTKKNKVITAQRQEFDRDLTTRSYKPSPKTISVANRTVDSVLATERPVVAFDLARMEPVLEVLLMEGARFTKQVPLLDSHNRYTIKAMLGSVRDLRIEGSELIGTHHYSKTAAGMEAFDLVAEKHLTDNSIGYQVSRSQMLEPGERKKFSKRFVKAPADMALRVGVEWTVKEVSATPIGADTAGKVRSNMEVKTMKITKKQRQYIEDTGLDPDNIDDEQIRKMVDMQKREEALDRREAAIDNKIAPARTPGEIAAQAELKREAREAEITRRNAIYDLAGDDIPAETVEECVSSGRSLDDCQAIFLRIVRDQRQAVAPAIHVIDHTQGREDLECALLIRSGMQDIAEKHFSERQLDKGDKNRRLPLFDLARYALIVDKKDVPIGTEAMLRAAFTSVTLPYILGAVANKSSLRGYNLAKSTWRSWCSVGSISNFQTQTRARLTDAGELELVNSAGEIKSGTVVEEYEQYSIATYGKNFTITRQNIINDDLSVLTKIPQAYGGKAAAKVSKLVYTHLLANGNMSDSVALFHATHKNLITSNGLSADALSKALYTYEQQVDADSEPIGVDPAVLLVPPELHSLGEELADSSEQLITGTTDARRGKKNVLKKANLKVESESRLSNSSYTGYSATTWFLMGNPNQVDTIEVGFLNGKQEPTVEQISVLEDVLGVKYRCYLDVGAKSLDHRGGQKSTA